MAKSKKALKALKRKKEAQKRSRVVKERQDYTAGGRVKAFTGINIGQDQIESATKAAEEYQKKQQEEAQANQNQGNQNQGNQNQGTQDQGTQDQGTSTEDNALAARRAELQRLGTIGMDTDGDGIISQAERNKALGVTPSKTPEQLKADADAKAKAKADAEAKAKADAKAREQAILAEQAKLDEQARIDEQALKRWETPSVAAKAAETTVDPSSFATVQDWGKSATSGTYTPDIWINETSFIVKAPDGTLSRVETEAEAQRVSGQSAPTTTVTDPSPEAAATEPATRAAAEAAKDTDDPFADSPFDFGGLTIKPNTEIRSIRINDGTRGSTSSMAPVPWGALTNRQKQSLINIYNNYPNPNQETDRAIAAYNYLNEQFGLKPRPEEEEDGEPPQYFRGDIPPEEEREDILRNFVNLKYEEFQPEPLSSDYRPGAQGQQLYNIAYQNWKLGKDWWDSQSPSERYDYYSAFTPEELSNGVSAGEKGPRLYPYVTNYGTFIDRDVPPSVGDPAKRVLDRVYDEDARSQYRVEEPEAFRVATTPQLGTQLTDRTLDAIEDVGKQDIDTTDLTADTGTFKRAVRQIVSSPAVMEAYNQAEANYFDKYPEARQAMVDGGYDNVFQYHQAEGVSKGYNLEFDNTKIAESDFNQLASAAAAEVTQTTAATRDLAAEEAALADRFLFTEDLRSQVDPVTGETVVLAATPDAEKQQRQAITDETAASGTEAIIQGSVGYEAAERRELKGEAARGAAVSLLEEVGEIPTEISEVILDNPAQITAQVDTQPVEVQAAIAALPQEALVSVQLENLLAGIDEGTTPTWARPAVQLVESRLSARGLGVSTVGRDALFNAIIQTSLPIAQSNAAALQQRANQNLSNQQQANLQQASQEMQLRLTNVANRQTAATQSAQLAQQINLTQGEIAQQTALTESQERQQVRLQSLQNEQQAAMANLGNDQQIELANLQVEAERLGANQTAANQERLAEMQVAANFMQKNSEFVQQMELANLSNDQQMRLAFLTAKNQAESENMTAAQQTELANLNKNLEVNKISANLAQQMGLAQLNVDQQRAMQNASTVANMDLAKFSTEQQIELANSKFMQTATLQDLSNRQQTIMQDATALASMDLQEADSLTKVSIENARNFLQKDMSELSIEQQAYMLDAQQRQQRMLTATTAENAASQFNATSQNQTNQFMASLGQQLELQNAAQENAMQQFNASETNRLAAIEAGNELEAEKLEAQLNAQIDQFNTQIDFQRDQWNQQNSQAVEQSNVNWRRQTNMAETAAQNAANQLQAQQLFQLSQQEQAFLWQQLRDEATYYRQQYESEQQRKTTLYATALANEAEHSVHNVQSTFNKIAGLFSQLGGMGSEAQRGRG